MGPIKNALAGPPQSQISIKNNELLRTSLRNFHTLIKMIGHQPTICCELIPNMPNYIGYCDASKLGVGGAWLPGRRSLAPVVWRLKFPPDIQAEVISFANPNRPITNSDLEMVGLLAQFLVLEHVAPMKLAHAAAWCNNTPTVSWANKLSSSKSMIAARLTQALAMQLHTNQASPLTTWSIAGVLNKMADMASRLFHR